MSKSTLFKEAIAEAKALRAAATANAKAILEESITPHIKELLASKLQEMEEEDDLAEESETPVEETFNTLEAAEDEPEESEDDAEEMPAEETPEEEVPEEMPAEEIPEEDQELGDITVNQFKELVRDIVAQELAGQASAGEELDGGELDGMEPEGDDMELDMGTSKEEPIDGPEEEEIDLDEIFGELEEEEAIRGKESKEDVYSKFGLKDKEPRKHTMMGGVPHKLKDGKWVPLKKVSETDTNLNEALNTINTLKSQLREVNILNAKLLYLNKMFKVSNLTESQKVKVIAAFDNAETVNEVKLIYKTLFENYNKNTRVKSRSQLKESKTSFASKATGNIVSKPVVEQVDETVQRWQKLAGIIKS